MLVSQVDPNEISVYRGKNGEVSNVRFNINSTNVNGQTKRGAFFMDVRDYRNSIKRLKDKYRNSQIDEEKQMVQSRLEFDRRAAAFDDQLRESRKSKGIVETEDGYLTKKKRIQAPRPLVLGETQADPLKCEGCGKRHSQSIGCEEAATNLIEVDEANLKKTHKVCRDCGEWVKKTTNSTDMWKIHDCVKKRGCSSPLIGSIVQCEYCHHAANKEGLMLHKQAEHPREYAQEQEASSEFQKDQKTDDFYLDKFNLAYAPVSIYDIDIEQTSPSEKLVRKVEETSMVRADSLIGNFHKLNYPGKTLEVYNPKQTNPIRFATKNIEQYTGDIPPANPLSGDFCSFAFNATKIPGVKLKPYMPGKYYKMVVQRDVAKSNEKIRRGTPLTKEDVLFHTTRIHHGGRYDTGIPTTHGDCTAMLFDTDGSLVGIHVISSNARQPPGCIAIDNNLFKFWHEETKDLVFPHAGKSQ